MSAVTPEDREKAIRALNEARRQATDGWEETPLQLDALIDLGWRPGGTRPDREALIEVLGGGYDWSAVIDIGVLADALLAADHLWTEQPSDDNADYREVFGRDPEPWREPLGALILTLADDTRPSWQIERARAEVEALSRVLNAQSPTPVVDREALVEWFKPLNPTDGGRIQLDVAAKWADALIASGAVQDAAVFRASVVAEQRERLLSAASVDAAARAAFEQGVGEWTWDDVLREEPDRAALWRDDARTVLVAAIRSGGSHERTETEP